MRFTSSRDQWRWGLGLSTRSHPHVPRERAQATWPGDVTNTQLGGKPPGTRATKWPHKSTVSVTPPATWPRSLCTSPSDRSLKDLRENYYSSFWSMIARYCRTFKAESIRSAVPPTAESKGGHAVHSSVPPVQTALQKHVRARPIVERDFKGPLQMYWGKMLLSVVPI